MISPLGSELDDILYPKPTAWLSRPLHGRSQHLHTTALSCIELCNLIDWTRSASLDAAAPSPSHRAISEVMEMLRGMTVDFLSRSMILMEGGGALRAIESPSPISAAFLICGLRGSDASKRARSTVSRCTVFYHYVKRGGLAALDLG